MSSPHASILPLHVQERTLQQLDLALQPPPVLRGLRQLSTDINTAMLHTITHT